MRPAASPHHHAFPSVAALNPPFHAAVLVADRVELIDFAEPDSADALMALDTAHAGTAAASAPVAMIPGLRTGAESTGSSAERATWQAVQRATLTPGGHEKLMHVPGMPMTMGPGTGF